MNKRHIYNLLVLSFWALSLFAQIREDNGRWLILFIKISPLVVYLCYVLYRFFSKKIVSLVQLMFYDLLFFVLYIIYSFFANLHKLGSIPH